MQKKLNNAKIYAAKVMNKTPNLLGEDTAVTEVEVQRQHGLLQNYIVVTVTRKNENPLAELSSVFLSGKQLSLSLSAHLIRESTGLTNWLLEGSWQPGEDTKRIPPSLSPCGICPRPPEVPLSHRWPQKSE